MKKYISLLCVAGATLLYTGCTDDFGQSSSSRYTGSDIIFGGRAGFEMDETRGGNTRTVYTGNIWQAQDENGTTKSYEGVNWVQGDKVRIFCADAAATTVADYAVSGISNTEAIEGIEEHEVALGKMDDAGLQWSDKTDYTFYAVYPSPRQYPLTAEGTPDAAYGNNVLNGTTRVKGAIPSVQPYRRLETTDGNYILHPKMEHAYMVARQEVKNAKQSGAEVYLNFVPVVTAVEIELKNVSNRELELTNVLVASADDSPVCGDFTADLAALTDGNGDGSYTGIPATGFVSTEDGEAGGSQITIPTYDENGGLQGDAIKLANGKTLKFTLFMLPTQDVDDLKLTLIGINGNRAGTTNGLVITKHKKTYLKQVPISIKQGDYDQSSWLEYIPDNALVNALSIPGAGGASSGYTANWETNKLFLEQSLTIDQLWAQGIRCFEFTVDKASNNTSFGTQNVICNNISTGMTLANAVKAVKDKLVENPREFAMVIITYQQESGWNVRENDGSVNQTRVPATFMEQMNYFWNTVKSGTNATIGAWPAATETDGIQTGTELYDARMTVKEARGKLFCIARPTSNGEDNFAEVETEYYGGFFGIGAYYELISTTYSKYSPDTPSVTNEDILVIHGWGALKDKWYARGFSDCVYKRGVGNSFYKAAAGLEETERNTLLGYTVNSDRPGRPYDVADNSGNNYSTLPDSAGGYAAKTKQLDLSDNVNFYYSTIHANSSGLQSQAAWVQEWARVAKESTTFTIESGQYARWISSVDEKKQHISECLDYALNQKIKGVAVDGVVFINSLCGYYISNDNQNSARPNSLTDCNLSNTASNSSGEWKFNRLTGASSTAGMCGNIESFATDMNNYFYDLLQSTTTNPDFTPGPMGIILMDRVSNNANDNGSKIPSIVIANNFQYTLPTAPTALDLPLDNLDENDVVAAPKRRSASSESGEMKIVWE